VTPDRDTRCRALAERCPHHDEVPEAKPKDPQRQLGTLGGGNHFIEVVSTPAYRLGHVALGFARIASDRQVFMSWRGR